MIKRSFKISKFATVLALSFVMLTDASAHCKWYDAPCKARQAAEKAAAAAAEALKEDAVPFEKNELRDYQNDTLNAYQNATATVKSGYQQSVNMVNTLINDALDQLFRASARSFTSRNSQAIMALRTRMAALQNDVAGMAALHRVIAAIATKALGSDDVNDMILLGQKIGFVANQQGQIVLSGITNSSWGISYGIGAAAGVGVNESYGLAMSTVQTNGNYTFGFIRSVGGSISPDLDAGSGQIGLWWAPQPVNQQGGPSVGFGGGAALDVGGEVDFSWSVPTTLPNAANAVPGISLIFTFPLVPTEVPTHVEYGWNISGGYSWVNVL